MKKLLLITFSLLFTILVNAQTADKKWNIGFHGGASQYHGDLGDGFYKTNTAFYGFGGISFSRYLGSRVDLSLLLTKGEVGFTSDKGHIRYQLTTGTLNVRFHILDPDVPVRPYLLIGGGAMMFANNLTSDKKFFDYAVPSFGAGVNIRMTESLMLNIQETFLYSTSDKRDGIEANTNDMFLMHSVGLTFNFGKKKDSDSDGVADRRDKCPGTPIGIKVDEKGCPLDKDNDGVADYQDACPDVAGVVALQGCPDRDNDGIADKDDNCPDVAGTAALNGCPDKDGDGVADKDDRCPDVAGTAELRGCPDADNDGVADIDDKCPDTKAGYKVDAAGCPLDNDKDGLVNEEDACPDLAGILALRGCPDTDGDGVPDNEDRCPTLKGTIVNKGCPEMTRAEVRKITEIASKIFFEFGSDKLKKESLPQLDALVDILKKYEGANLTIEGHTDNVGDDAFNMELSQKRTESVKLYLMSKGIMESRLTAIGYGESKPIADNKTSAGRAVNRRVELKTSY